MLKNMSKPVVQKFFYWTPLLALFVVLACNSGTDSKSSNPLNKGTPTNLVFGNQDGSSVTNAIAVSGTAGNTLYGGNNFDPNVLVKDAKGTLSFYTVDSNGTEAAINNPATYTLPSTAVTILVKAAGDGDYSSKWLYFSITPAAKGISTFAKNSAPSGFNIGNEAATFADPIVVTLNSGDPIGTFNLANLVTGGNNLSYDSVATNGDGSEGTATPIPAANVATYAPGAGEVIIKITDGGNASTVAAAAPLYFKITFVAAQANNLALQATSGNYTIATTGTNDNGDTTDGSTFALAAAVTNSTPITTATAISFANFTTAPTGTLVYHIVTSAQAATPGQGTAITDGTNYTHNTAETIVVRIYDPGSNMVAAKSLFVSVEVAARANNLALQATSGNYTIATTGTNDNGDTTDGSTFARAAAVTNTTATITTATAINFTGFTSTSAGTLVYHIVTSAQASDPTLGTSISSPYTHNTAGTIVVRIYDPGTTSVAAKSLFVSVVVAIADSGFTFDTPTGGYSLDSATDGLSYANAKAVTNTTATITTATPIDFSSFTTSAAGTLAYHIVTSAQASDPTLGTSISSPYTQTTADTIVVRIYDPGTPNAVAAKSLFVSVVVAIADSGFTFDTPTGGYSLDSATDGLSYANAKAVTNTTATITTATPIDFSSFTTSAAGTLAYHIVTSAQASDPTLGTSISSPYTQTTADTIVVRIYDPGTPNAVAAKSLFVSVVVAIADSGFTFDTPTGGYSLDSATDGLSYANAKAVTNTTATITTATPIDFSSFTTSAAGTLAYHIVTSAQASDPTLGTSISSPYTQTTADTIVVRIYDPGTPNAVAAKSLFVSVVVAIADSGFTFDTPTGGYSLDSATDGLSYANAKAVTNTTATITTATPIDFSSFTTGAAGTLVYHIVNSAQAANPGEGTSISSPYTQTTADTIVVRIYDPGTTDAVAAKSLFVSVVVAIADSGFTFDTPTGGYSLDSATDGLSYANAKAVTNTTATITTATPIDFSSFTTGAAGTLVYHIVNSAQAANPGEGTSISSPYTQTTADTIVVRIYDPGTTDAVAAKSLFVSVVVAIADSGFTFDTPTGGYSLDSATDGLSYANAKAVTNTTATITTATPIDFSSFTTGAAGTLVYHIVNSAQAANPGEGTSISSPYTQTTADTIVVRIYDPGTTDAVAAKSLFVSVVVAIADSGFTFDTPTGGYSLDSATDGLSYANAKAVTNTTATITTATPIDFSSFTTGAAGTLVYHIVNSAQAANPGEGTSISSPYTQTTADTIVVRIYDPGTTDAVAAKSLFVSVVVAIADSGFTFDTPTGGYSLDSATDGLSYANAKAVTNTTATITTATPIDFSSFTTGAAGTLVYHIVNSAQAANPGEGTSISSPYTQTTADTIVVRIYDPGTTDAVAAKSLFVSVVVAIADSGFTFDTPTGGYSLDSATDGLSYANAKAVTNTTATITTATPIDFSSFTTGAAGTLVYHIVNSAQAANPGEGTSISSPYTQTTADTIVVRIYDPGTTDAVAAKSLFVSVVVAIADSGFTFDTPTGGYSLDSATDGLSYANAKAVTNTTATITTATPIDFSSFTTGAAGTLVYHIVNSAQAANPGEGTSISSPYTQTTADTIVVRIYDPGTTDAVAAKSLFVSVVVAIADSGFTFDTPTGGYSLDSATDGLSYANAKAVTNTTATITTATPIDFSSFTTGAAGTLVYHIVNSAQAANPGEGTSISSPYTQTTTDTIVVRIYDPGTTDAVAAKSLFVSVFVAVQNSSFTFDTPTGGYSLDSATDGLSYANAKAVTNTTATITTATPIDFSSFTTGAAGTLVYHIVTSAQASDPTLGTSISSPYTPTSTGTIVVRIYDPGTPNAVAAKWLFVSVLVS